MCNTFIVLLYQQVQAKDCNPLQNYDAKNCRCLCKQNLSKPAAGTNPATCKPPLCTTHFIFLCTFKRISSMTNVISTLHLDWDERNCRCRCPPQSITDCSTGSYFSSEKCM